MIFNEPEFHALNGVEPTTVGCLTGVSCDGVFTVGHSASFGAIDTTDDTPPWRVQEMVEDAVGVFHKDPVRIKLPPPCYSLTWNATVTALVSCGFRIERAELSQFIKPATAKLSKPARKAMLDGRYAGMWLWECAGLVEWSAAYDVLAKNREAKGRALKLSKKYVVQMRDTFPGRVRMFMAGAVAAALVYEVKPRYWLVVYWGDLPDHGLPVSPMPFLANELTNKALEERVNIVDLGISSVDGEIDAGLAQFKRSVGARDGVRLDMVRGM